MLEPLSLVFFFLTILWLIGISFLLWKQYTFQKLLLHHSEKKTLSEILEGIIRDAQMNKKALQELSKRYDTIEKEGKFHIQKMGLLRFNPFKDTGGDQSFILTLVDAYDTGIIISGLYSRSGTRWYAKKIVKGKAVEHDLSDEEKKALKLAQPISLQ